MTSGVYRIVNTVTNRTYIGSSTHMVNRLVRHKKELRQGHHFNDHLQRSWTKHGEASFIFEPLIVCAVDRMRVREQKFIDAYADHDMPLYNHGPVIMDGYTMSPQMVQKQTVRMLGNTYRRGKLSSPETRAKNSAALVGNKYRLGIPHTAETIAKIRAWRPTVEQRAKMSVTHKRAWASNDERRKNTSDQFKALWASSEYRNKVMSSRKSALARRQQEYT